MQELAAPLRKQQRRIAIVTIGTRGDVQPYVALARGLVEAGNEVVLCTHATFQPFVTQHGIGFAPLAGDIRSLLASNAGRRLLAQRNPLSAVRQLQQLAAPILHAVMADIIAATEGADLILGSTLGYLNAVTAGQVHGAPLLLAGLQPFTPTSAFPSALLAPPRRKFPGVGLYNRLTHLATYRLLQLVSARLANRCRRALTGLPPLRYSDVFGDLISQRRPVLYGFSEHLLPRPPDYGAQIEITGFWFLGVQDGWQPPAALEAFLDAGEPPVYIGFGSMSDRTPEQAARIALEALRLSGQRGILSTGWEGLAAQHLPDTVLRVDDIPHAWLFSRVKAVVHHGGAGTTAAALRAGVAQVIVPFGADQPLWAEQVFRRGVGPEPIPRRRLSAANLAGSIATALGNDAIQRNAGTIGSAVRREEGVGRAVAVIMNHLGGCPTPPLL